MKTQKLFNLSGNVALVTGGNGGIGRAIAIGLAECGTSVAILGRNDEKNKSVISELKKIGIPALAVRIDLTQRETLEQAVKTSEKE